MRVLENKQYQIEGVINDHLKFLHGKANFLRFAELTFIQKLDYLSSYNSELKNGKKQDEGKITFSRLVQGEAKDEVLHSERLRLEGITLSYDAYESIAFSKIKDIKEIMDETLNRLKRNYTLEDDESK